MSLPALPEHREAFLRRQGWSESLPEEVRLALETFWTDSNIEHARALGFS